MEKELEYILGAMNYEIFYDWSEFARDQLKVPRFLELNPDFPAKLRTQFAELLQSRWMSADDYEQLTGVSIDSDELLYDFLGRAYRFIFEGETPDDPPYPPQANYDEEGSVHATGGHPLLPHTALTEAVSAEPWKAWRP
ncbi:hypothetical protein ABZ319_32890 [Nocardia sp. NPDC005978]|uniref:hypothetical protein n=1 Tax=Nocardia sp. NPDC005978 TaxID=3156725 RepID=UPI0033AE6F07